MRVLHCADIHLGRRPFNMEERFEDFGRAFLHIARRAAEESADVLLIAGDFFDKRNINAATWTQALAGLKILKESGVETVAIEGNHDKAFRRDRFSWLESLCGQEFLRLLKPVESGDRLDLPVWDEGARIGAVLELDGVRIVGLGYRGAQADLFLERAASALPFAPDRFTIAALHSGVGESEGLILGSVSEAALSRLAGKAQIAALGHWHRRQEWRAGGVLALMPGSPEVCDLREAAYERGFYWIDTPGGPGGEPVVVHEPAPCRPHRRVSVRLEECPNAGAVVSAAERAASALADLEPAPVVELLLEGAYAFDASDVPVERAREAAQRASGALHVEAANRANLGVLSGERSDCV